MSGERVQNPDSHEVLEPAGNAVIQKDRLNQLLISVAQNPPGPRLQFLIWNQKKTTVWGVQSRERGPSL